MNRQGHTFLDILERSKREDTDYINGVTLKMKNGDDKNPSG